uniref:Polypeptide N-acetylgalactosaminyltransferase n=1 Tax=Macrostomum lignano TaxID=282301 RepID=A0A1I8J537_9PLAT
QGERWRGEQPAIIIPFHEEHWSTLLRTVVSCIHRAPRHLVKEVILVDDFSKKSFLGDPLENGCRSRICVVRPVMAGDQHQIWQCGGRMVDTGCSRIGHVYRKYAPFPNPGVGDFIGRNYRRVAEVWMDEYAEYIYNRRPHYKSIPAGDLTSQREIRERLHCKPFKWFMTNVAFDLPLRYPPVEPPSAASGEIRSAADASLCIDTRFKGGMQSFGLAKCIKGGGGLSGEQNFIFTFRKDIHPADRAFCFDVSQHAVKAPVILYQCHYQKGNQHWKINPNTGQLYHVASRLCLDSEPARLEIFMNSCNPARQTQLWKWGTTDPKQLERDWANN